MTFLKKLLILILCCFVLPLILVQAQLTVSENGRFFVKSDGSPFYWLGDSGWALFQKLKNEDVELYCKTRSQQGFSVIHAAVYHVNPFVLPPLSSVYGDLPFINDDPRQPDITPGNSQIDSTEYFPDSPWLDFHML